MSGPWRTSLPSNRSVVDPGEHRTYPSPTVPAVRVGELIVLSGIVGMDQLRGTAEGDAGAQASQALHIIDGALSALDSSLADVVRMTIYLARHEDLANVAAVLDATFGRPWPPTTIVAVAALGRRDLLVEIETTAAVREVGP